MTQVRLQNIALDMLQVPDMNQSKAELIEERRSNLPLPEQPQGSADLSSADGSKTSIGSGQTSDNAISHGNSALREPATGFEDQNQVGREGKDGLGGLPNDAVTQGSKNKEGLSDTKK